MNKGSKFEDCGVIYAVSGARYVAEARISAQSLKQQTPNLPIALYTDSIPEYKNLNEFSTVVSIQEKENRIKIKSMIDAPFKYNLFLDSDTYICSPIKNMFEILKRFDIAATHAPIREHPVEVSKWGGYRVENVPSSFPEMNTGVILFKKSSKVKNMLKEWLSIYDYYRGQAEGRIPDQPAFRKAVFESDLCLATLPEEYNFRIQFPRYVEGKVKIVHGRSQSLSYDAQRLNRREGPRVFVPGIGVIHSRCFLVRVLQKIRNLLAV